MSIKDLGAALGRNLTQRITRILPLTFTVLLLVSSAYGALITLPYTYVNGQVLTATELNQDFQTIYNDYNGNITNANLSATAAIALSKLGLNPGQPALDLQTTGNLCWGSGLTTDTQPRCVMTSDGKLEFGVGGTTAPDVDFQHSATTTVQLQPANSTIDLNSGNIINGNFGIQGIQGLRVSISSTLPVPADGTNTTIYAVPYTSGYISLYNASNVWVTDVVATNLSIAVPATTNTAYDIYVVDSSGTATIGLAVWTGNTPPTRGNQNGVPYTNNNVHDRLIGCIATNGTSGTVEDDSSARYVWNYNNQVVRTLFAQVPVATWTYNASSWRASDANTTLGQGRAGVLVGLANQALTSTFVQGTDSGGQIGYAGIGLNVTSGTPTVWSGNFNSAGPITATGTFTAPAGIDYLQMMEAANNPSSTTYTGNPAWTSGLAYGQSYLSGITLQ